MTAQPMGPGLVQGRQPDRRGRPGHSGFEQVVLMHAWTFENEGEQPFVVVALSKGPTDDIDGFDVQSITGPDFRAAGGDVARPVDAGRRPVYTRSLSDLTLTCC